MAKCEKCPYAFRTSTEDFHCKLEIDPKFCKKENDMKLKRHYLICGAISLLICLAATFCCGWFTASHIADDKQIANAYSSDSIKSFVALYELDTGEKVNDVIESKRERKIHLVTDAGVATFELVAKEPYVYQWERTN